MKGRCKERSKMKYPEGQKKSESDKVYIRRITKLPTLSPNTILRVVFRKANKDNLQHIKDWARPVFPKAFPPEDSNGIPFINPENISTKAFAKWMAEEDIFEALRSLGEKPPSPIAKLFPVKIIRTPENEQGQFGRQRGIQSYRLVISKHTSKPNGEKL